MVRKCLGEWELHGAFDVEIISIKSKCVKASANTCELSINEIWRLQDFVTLQIILQWFIRGSNEVNHNTSVLLIRVECLYLRVLLKANTIRNYKGLKYRVGERQCSVSFLIQFDLILLHKKRFPRKQRTIRTSVKDLDNFLFSPLPFHHRPHLNVTYCIYYLLLET